MSGHFSWYVARSSGFVAWGIALASILWGLAYAARFFGRRPAPWWMLGMHRWLGALAVVFTGVHVVAILANHYVHFGVLDVLIPMRASWHPLAVAWGIVATYLLIAVEVTSLVKHRLPHPVWHAIHLSSYALFAFATVHLLSAGTSSKSLLTTGVSVSLGCLVVLLAALAYAVRTEPEPVPARNTR